MKKWMMLFLVVCCLAGCEKSQETVLWESTAESDSQEAESTLISEQQQIYIDVCGAVNQPGVVQLESGARVYEAIAAAGGFTKEAAKEQINQAAPLNDGEQLRIYTREEVENGVADAATSDNGTVSPSADDGKININEATAEELMTLPGIGEAKASDIIRYREEQGAFAAIEDIMNISGIKEAVFSKIKDKIRT